MKAEQLRAARGLIRWSQAELAERSGVSVPTIKRIEAVDGEIVANKTTLNALESALVEAGVTFLESGQTADGPGVALSS